MILETTRLQLRLFSPAALLGLTGAYDPHRFVQIFGVAPADGFGDFFRSADVSPDWLARLDASAPADPWVHGFAVIEKAHRLVIGSMGFKGSADEDGVVEIGYGIVPAFARQGYATEAASAGVAFAFEHANVGCVRAHTHARHGASARVLEKCGFDYVGQFTDPEDGDVARWETTSAGQRAKGRGQR